MALMDAPTCPNLDTIYRFIPLPWWLREDVELGLVCLNFGFYWTASHTDLASLPMVTLLNFIASTDCFNKDFYTAIIYRAIIVI